MSDTKMKAVGLIPARLESSRLPRKALLDICGLPMIVHVYFRCKLASKLSDLYVCTDNPEIKKSVESYGGKVIMTSSQHKTGSDRIAEAAKTIDADIIVNIQGDEALVDPRYIDLTVNEFENNRQVEFSLLTNHFLKRESPSDIKVVVNKFSDVMYLSRTDIPSFARTEHSSLLKAYHIVGFRKESLIEYASWDETPLEKIEFNEYLRILENGRKIRSILVESSAISVDTLHDLEFVRSKMKEDSLFKNYSIGRI